MSKSVEEIDAEIEALKALREEQAKGEKKEAKTQANELIKKYSLTLGDLRGEAQKILLDSITKLGDATLKEVKAKIEAKLKK